LSYPLETLPLFFACTRKNKNRKQRSLAIGWDYMAIGKINLMNVHECHVTLHTFLPKNLSGGVLSDDLGK
jgi:hypothetical protein